MSRLVEALFTRLYHVEPLDPADPDVPMRIAFQRYAGAPFTLPDGAAIAPGDVVCELHMRNDLLHELHTRLGDPARVGATYIRMMRDAMRRASELWGSGGRFDGVAALYGVSLFPEHIMRTGFTVRPLQPPWRRRLVGWWSRKVVAGFHPEGRARVLDADGKPREVHEVWISRARCLECFPPKPRAASGAPTSADPHEL